MINADLYVVIAKPTNPEEIKRVEDAIGLLMEIDKAIGKCSTTAHDGNPQFRKAAEGLSKILSGEWMY